MNKHGMMACIVCLLVVFVLGGGFPFAQEKFPTKPINIIVPFSPGGNVDVNAQLMRSHLQKILGVSVVVVSKPGGSTTIGANLAANSPPDGYTLMAHTPSLLCTRYTVKSGVSHEKFVPVIRTVVVPLAITVRADAPWKDFKEFIDHAKKNPEKVKEGHSGVGAMAHLTAVGLEMTTGAKFTHVPFKGAGPSITALVGGHIDFMLHDLSSTFPFIQAKKLRALGVSSVERSHVVPDVPTFKELGLDLDVGSWVTYFVPKGTAKERIEILHQAFKEAMNTPEHLDMYKKQGGIVEYMEPENLAGFLDQQDKFLKKIIDFAGIKPME